MPLLNILLITSIAITERDSCDLQNQVHEWGIVVFEENTNLVCGETWRNSDYYSDFEYLEMCAEAPVVWIHGEPFDEAVFTVSTGREAITFTYPTPDNVSQGVVEWHISSANSAPEASLSEETTEVYQGPFWWAVDSWREVSSLSLFQESSGITENFLYYECTVERDFTDNFFSWGENGNPVLTNLYIPEAILFTPEGVVSVTTSELIPNLLSLPITSEIDSAAIVSIFSNWANSKLDDMEVTALWETWEPVFTEDATYWMVFPIPVEHNNDISSIHLEISDGRNVEYSRFFLGAVRINLP